MTNTDQKTKRLAILTSGGDAPGMNATIRAAVRTALDLEGEWLPAVLAKANRQLAHLRRLRRAYVQWCSM